MTPCDRCARPQDQAGFSYLWLLLLVAFLGIGLTVAVEIDSTVAQRDREKELLAQGRQFRTAIGRYYESLQGGGKREYPAALEDLLQDKRSAGAKRHLRKIFIDPMTRKPEWGLIRVSGRIVGVHSLSDAKPIKQEGFEAEDMGLRNKSRYSDWQFVYPPDLILQQEAGTASAAKPSIDLPSVSSLTKEGFKP